MKTKLKLILTIAFILIAIVNIKVYAENETFSIQEQTLNVKLNGTGILHYSGGEGTITWKSSDPSVATVEKGEIKGLKIGTATITATRGGETASCKVSVIYSSLNINSNKGKYTKEINLVMGVHETEILSTEIQDATSKKIENAQTTWSSSDTSIVTVDSNGKLQAKKQGTATITATSAGVSASCEVKVSSAPTHTDFTNAKYELGLNSSYGELRISNVESKKENSYYIIITKNNSKPELYKTSSGNFDKEKMSNTLLEGYCQENKDIIIKGDAITEAMESGQEMYLWMIEKVSLSNSWYDENGNVVISDTRFVEEAVKLSKKSPSIDSVIEFLLIHEDEYNPTRIGFNYPTVNENRKFTLKIGKVTDSGILSKINNNDNTGFTDLLSYAKTHDAVYNEKLTTTSKGEYKSDRKLFDGTKLLENDSYYYVYVNFDDENGKYYPVEGITLIQAYVGITYWDLLAYKPGEMKWNDANESLEQVKNEVQSEAPKQTNDKTIAKQSLPNTGANIIMITIAGTIIIIAGVISYKKYNKLKEIK